MPATDDPLLLLWKDAKLGCPDAANELAKRVRPWTIKEAHRYEIKYGSVITADDFISAAYAKFMPVVNAYNPSRGASFMGYYCACAGRAMVEVFQRYQRNDELLSLSETPIRSEETHDPEPEHARQRVGVNTALQWISPFERRILEAVSGANGRPRSLPEVAKFLRIADADATAMFDRLTDRVVRHIASNSHRGRRPDPILAEIVDYARDRRAARVKWKTVCDEVAAKWGRRYSVRILKAIVHNKGKKQSR